MLRRFLAYVIGSFVGVLALGTIFQGGIITYESVRDVFIFSLLLALLMTMIKPILTLLTLPISCITFGLFAVVINALMFYLATLVTSGVDADWLGMAIGGLVVSVLGGIAFAVVDE